MPPDQPDVRTGHRWPRLRRRSRRRVPVTAVHEALASAVRAAAAETGDPYGEALLTLVRRTADAIGGTVMVTASNGDDTARWTAGGGFGTADESTSRPVSVAGRQVGTWSMDRPDSLAPDGLALLVDCAAWLLDQRTLVATVAGFRRAALHAEATLAEERQRAAVDMDHERRNLEHDLHDGAQADLVAAKAHLSLLLRALRGNDRDAAGEQTRLLVDVLGAVSRRIDGVARGLAPEELLEHGLVPALQAALAPYGAEQPVTVHAAIGDRRYPPEIELTAYFVCLEAVTNAGKHAAGSTVVVDVEHRSAGLFVAVSDTGPGIDPARLSTAFGALRRRIESVSGRFAVESTPGTGTRIEALLPL